MLGKPALLFITTNYTKPQITLTTPVHKIETNVPDSAIYQLNNHIENSDWIPVSENFIDNQSPFRLHIKMPYFENNRLKTSISWFNHSKCNEIGKKFQIYIRSLRCINELPPQKFEVDNCLTTFENLQFECDYFVEIKIIKSSEVIFFAVFSFRTPMCINFNKTNIKILALI